MIKQILKHFHFCCGLGGGAKGFNRNKEIVNNMQAEWRCIGGVDNDAAALRDFRTLAGVPGTLLDLFTREQYTGNGHFRTSDVSKLLRRAERCRSIAETCPMPEETEF